MSAKKREREKWNGGHGQCGSTAALGCRGGGQFAGAAFAQCPIGMLGVCDGQLFLDMCRIHAIPVAYIYTRIHLYVYIL